MLLSLKYWAHEFGQKKPSLPINWIVSDQRELKRYFKFNEKIWKTIQNHDSTDQTFFFSGFSFANLWLFFQKKNFFFF